LVIRNLVLKNLDNNQQQQLTIKKIKTMIRNVLESIQGIDIFPIISLTIFFVSFILMLIWVLKVDKKYIKKMSEMPLEK
jgi:hypothetical protein